VSAFTAERIKHLEMIQAVIARLGSDSFLVKGWAVTATGVFLGFAVANDEPWLAVPSALVTLLLWMLDTYYLRSERLFRLLFDRARHVDAAGYEPFAMNATGKRFRDSLAAADRKCVTRRAVAFSGTLLSLYAALLLAAGAIAWVTETQISQASASESSPHQSSGPDERD